MKQIKSPMKLFNCLLFFFLTHCELYDDVFGFVDYDAENDVIINPKVTEDSLYVFRLRLFSQNGK